MRTFTRFLLACSFCLAALAITCPFAVAQEKKDTKQEKKAQKPRPILELNFNEREQWFDSSQIKDLNDLKKGQFYVIKINNINTLNYKVLISNRDTMKSTGLAVPSYGGIGAADLSSLAALLPGFGVNGAAPVSSTVNVIASAEKAGNFINTATLREMLAGRTDSAGAIIKRYASTLKEEVTLLTQLNDTIGKLLTTNNRYVWQARLDAAKKQLPDTTALDKFLNAASRLYSRATEQSDRTAKDHAKYLDRLKDKKLSDAEKKSNEDLEAAYEELTKSIAKVKALVSVENIRPLTESLINVINSNQRTYTSLPLMFTKEQTALRIDIVPQDKASGAQAYTTTLVFPLTKKSFWGVSSGFFISGLYNDAYSTQAIQTSSGATPTYAIRQESPGNYELGASAMVRYGFTFNPTASLPVGLQLGFGPALAVTNKVRPRLMLGGGLAFGANHKLLLDFGANLGYVDRLSTAYESPTQPAPTYYTQPTNLTVSTLRTSWFAGIHYLFLKY